MRQQKTALETNGALSLSYLGSCLYFEANVVSERAPRKFPNNSGKNLKSKRQNYRTDSDHEAFSGSTEELGMESYDKEDS